MSDIKEVRLKESIVIKNLEGEYSLPKGEILEVVIDNDDYDSVLISRKDRPLIPISISREMIEYIY